MPQGVPSRPTSSSPKATATTSRSRRPMVPAPVPTSHVRPARSPPGFPSSGFPTSPGASRATTSMPGRRWVWRSRAPIWSGSCAACSTSRSGTRRSGSSTASPSEPSRPCSICSPRLAVSSRGRSAPRCIPRGPWMSSRPTRPAPRGAWPKPTARAPHAPSARPRCRCTAGSATRGTASSTSISAGLCFPRSGSGTTASSCASSSGSVWRCPTDFRDSPAEAEFRSRLRAWIAEHNPGLPVSSTDDEYWARQAEWHTALYDAGFFGLSWPSRFGGHDLPAVFDVILDEELAAAGAPPRPSLGYLVQGITTHAGEAIQQRFLPGLISGRERWCQGFSEPDAGSDLASLRTTATRDGDEYVIHGHKIWTSYSDVADWCFLLARTDPDVPKHKGLSAFAVPMRQPGIEQYPLRMINGITREFGQVVFDGARVPAENMIGKPGEGWRIAMTIVSHEREPGEVGYVARYVKTVKDLEATVRAKPGAFRSDQREAVAWAYVQAEMLRLHVRRRLSERLDGVDHGPGGSIDKILMTWVEQTVGAAALSVAGSHAVVDGDDVGLKIYLYSRAQSVMGGTSQIQKNIIATRILGLPSI